MRRCPLCRADLGEAETCRRCRADFGAVKALERASQALAAAASHRLAEGDLAAAQILAGRAAVLHATPENKALSDLLRNLRRYAVSEIARSGPTALRNPNGKLVI